MDFVREDEAQGEHEQVAARDLKEPLGGKLDVKNRAAMANAGAKA